MSKVLYIHVGNFKTGTSAIQKFCSDKAESLKKEGLYYFSGCRPENNVTNHGRLSLELFKKFGGHPPGWYTDKFDYNSAINEIKSEINSNNNFSKFLISSEEFFRLGGIANSREAVDYFKNSLQDLNIEVKIIIYVREPLEFLVSWYNQITKGIDLPTRTFNDFVMNIEEFYVNPFINYEVWSSVFGVENVIVKEYQYKGNEHLKDFLGIMTEGFSDFPEESSAAVNTGIKNRKLEKDRMVKLIRGHFSNRLNKKLKINGYINSEVLMKSIKARELSDKVNFLYLRNRDFYKQFFDKDIQHFDVFDVIEQSANINYIDIHTFWEFNPSVEGLINIAKSLKESNQNLSLSLFKIAQRSRPKGQFIQQNIDELTKLTNNH